MQFPYKKQIQHQVDPVCATEIIIGKRLFSCALRIDAPSSYRAINGYETAEIKKYCLAILHNLRLNFSEDHSQDLMVKDQA